MFTVNRRLLMLRTRLGLSRSEMERQLDGVVTAPRINTIELSEPHPTMAHLIKVCDLYDVDAHSLLIGSESPRQNTKRPPTNPAEFGDRIADFRKLSGMSIPEFAEALDAPPEAIEAIEANHILPLYCTIFLLFHRLEADVEWLMFGESRSGSTRIKIETEHIRKVFHSIYPITPHKPSRLYSSYRKSARGKMGGRPTAHSPRELRAQYTQFRSLEAIARHEGITATGVAQRFGKAGININALRRRLVLYDVIIGYKKYLSVDRWSTKSGIKRHKLMSKISRAGLTKKRLREKYGHKPYQPVKVARKKTKRTKDSKPKPISTNGQKHWSQGEIDQLIRHVDDGLTATQIGTLMATTRGAVLGKIHRLRKTGVLAEAAKTPPNPKKPRVNTPKVARKYNDDHRRVLTELNDYPLLRTLVQCGGLGRTSLALGVPVELLKERLKTIGVEYVSRIRTSHIPASSDDKRGAFFDFSYIGHGVRHRVIKHRLAQVDVKFAHVDKHAVKVSEGTKWSLPVATALAEHLETTPDKIWPELYGAQILSYSELLQVAKNYLRQAKELGLLERRFHMDRHYEDDPIERYLWCRIVSSPQATITEQLEIDRSLDPGSGSKFLEQQTQEAVYRTEQSFLTSSHP